MINLIVNGKPREADDELSLEQFLETIDVNLRFVAVGYNGEVIKKDELLRHHPRQRRYPGNRPSRRRGLTRRARIPHP